MRIALAVTPTAMWMLKLARFVVLVALATALAYSFGVIATRPIDGVEGEVLYQAQRIRASFPLYVSPERGAFEEGPVPARYFVLYPPLWAAMLSLVPRAWMAMVGRLVACAAWFGVLLAIPLRAPRPQRRASLVAAAFAGGVYTLALFASAARPDSLAVCLAGAGLLNAVEKRRVDFVTGVLFALAAWTKPNVLGIGTGAFLAGLWVDRRAALRAAAGALVVSAVMVGILHVASGGTWLQHLIFSTGQPLNAAVWKESALWRLQFVGAPLAVALGFAWRARRDDAARIAFGALAVSMAWALVSLGKIGSASNYWMEPAVAAVVAVSRAPFAWPPRPSSAVLSAAGVLLQVLWTDVGSIRSSIEAIVIDREQANFMAHARTDCGARDGEIVLADAPGLELMLNGRIVTTPFQMSHLVRRGLYPLGTWIADIERPEIRCLVMQDDLLERPLDDVRVAHDQFVPEVRRILRAKFAPVEERGGLRLYTARDVRAQNGSR
jgi:hypothetical protein